MAAREVIKFQEIDLKFGAWRKFADPSFQLMSSVKPK